MAIIAISPLGGESAPPMLMAPAPGADPAIGAGAGIAPPPMLPIILSIIPIILSIIMGISPPWGGLPEGGAPAAMPGFPFIAIPPAAPIAGCCMEASSCCILSRIFANLSARTGSPPFPALGLFAPAGADMAAAPILGMAPDEAGNC